MPFINKLRPQPAVKAAVPKMPMWPGEPPHAPSRKAAEAFIKAQAFWYHRIYLGNGLYTMPGAAYHELVWQRFRPAFPADLRGASVLDIGSNAGFFSLQAKLLGAGRVLGVELIDMYLQQADTIKRWWGLDDIEYRADEAQAIDRLEEKFDLVVCAGILYHLKNPLYVLEQIGRLCTDAVLIETECIPADPRNVVVVRQGPCGQAQPTPTTRGFMKLIEADELDGDGSNWWVPDAECVMGMLRIAGFTQFSAPIYQTPNRLALAASKRPDSLLNLSAIQ
jgi:tRNA (mo5U34)-methyltransferase